MKECSDHGRDAGGHCTLPCSAAAALEPVLFAEAAARFQAEATRASLDTGRYRLPYFAWGDGPPLVFVHGVGDVSRSFLLPISRLSTHFRCIAYDLPNGHNDGARPGRYRHEDLAVDLLALVDHLGAGRSYLFGSSFGATVVLRDAAAPDRFPRAILQGGVAHRPLRRLERALAWLARRLPGRMGALPRRERLLAKVHGAPFAGRPAEVWRAFLDSTAEARIAAVGHQARLLHALDLRGDLPHIKQPVLLVHGDRDAVMPRRYLETLRDGLPSSGVAVIEGCGHMPYYTHPEALAEVVRRFLTPPGAGCAGAAGCGMAAGYPARGG